MCGGNTKTHTHTSPWLNLEGERCYGVHFSLAIGNADGRRCSTKLCSTLSDRRLPFLGCQCCCCCSICSTLSDPLLPFLWLPVLLLLLHLILFSLLLLVAVVLLLLLPLLLLLLPPPLLLLLAVSLLCPDLVLLPLL